MPTVQAEPLRTWCRALLGSWGYGPEDADFLATTLVEANLRGIDSHGVIRLSAYYRRIVVGLIDPAAVPTVRRDRALVHVDAVRAAGQIAARTAMAEVAAVAREHGVATVDVSGSAHFGTAGFYARALAEQGFVAFVLSNSEPIVVPFGGREALFGTNPFAFAAPGPEFPISLDMATSTSAMGKVLLAQAEGTAIPGDWGVDADGVATTDPGQVQALLPAAGPKGYGLAFLIEVLAGLLSGSAVGHELGNLYHDLDRPQNVGHWMMAVDVGSHVPIADFTGRMATLIAMAHNTAPTAGVDSVLVPGEPEERTRQLRHRDGINLPPAVTNDLDNLGERCGVAFDIPLEQEKEA